MEKNNMKRLLIYILFSFFSLSGLISQTDSNLDQGIVSYKSTTNVYVKFSSTKNIKIGDTLFVQLDSRLVPALVVKHLSSISAVGTPLGNIVLEVNDRTVAKNPSPMKLPNEEPKQLDPKDVELSEEINEDVINELIMTQPERPQIIHGRLAINSYSSRSSEKNEGITRLRYTLSGKAENIGGSKFTAESYAIYRQKYIGGSLFQDTLQNPLRFYNLALQYDFNDASRIIVGRKINPYVSNLGAIDGVQGQFGTGNFLFGAIVGSRPDFINYGYNAELMEYGGYFSHQLNKSSGYMQTTLAVMEQKNNAKTDRRFSYIQHSNSLAKNVNLFTSFEIDMYKVEKELPTNSFSLSSMYISLRYRPTRKFSIAASYDARKNVIYYESYKNFIDQLIDIETRQGFRLRFNFRPIKYLTMGSSAGYRYQANTPKPSRSLYNYLSYTRVPFIQASVSLTSTILSTNYLEGLIYGIRINKNFINGRLGVQMHYKKVNYTYAYTETPLNQRIAGINLTFRIVRSLSFSLTYEGTFEEKRQNALIFTNLIKRF
jgi:hypothetical protein